MTSRKNNVRSQIKRQQPQKKQDSILKEAWDNMAGDFNRLMPEKIRKHKGKKGFVLWLFVLELVVFGVVGKIVYEWWAG